MATFYSYLVIALATLYASSNVLAKQKGATNIDELRAHYIDLEKSLWKYLEQRTDANQNQKLKKVFESNRIFTLQNFRKEFIYDKYFPLQRFYEWSLLEIDFRIINELFQYFRETLIKYENGNYDERATRDLAESVLDDPKISIKNTSIKIHNVMTLQGFYYRSIGASNEQICATKQSPQQFLYSLYSDITLTELKGYAMMQFSWMILNIYDKGNFTDEAKLMRADFEKRSIESQEMVKQVMQRADRVLWTCDPPVYVKGETYDEVTRLLQGYIENEVDMNPDHTCRENCGYYVESKSHGCFKDLYCSRQPRCNGKILSCTYVDSDMWICPASEKSTRRYEYITYENGRSLGKPGHCVRGTTKVDSWWRWLFWHCSYCFCLCDEQGVKSDRYFNLRETISDVDKNKVVTGLRFVKKNRVFHLQIQQGELAPRGNINETSLQWKPVEEYKIFDLNVSPGIDYHTLTASSRAVDLDDLMADVPSYIVTGVKFRVVGAHLNLEMRITEFDFEAGKLVEPHVTSYWISNDNTDVSGNRRTEVKLKSPDVSTNSQVKSVPKSSHNQYIHFVNTDMDKDAAQNTVPFIDIQDVVSNPPVPLSGVGLYHKGQDQYGGFLAPKVITYDFSPHIQSPSFDNQTN
ncbi:unnamed protein product [Hermetia illucens]|uniref:Uncharacterized protein n=1 Tax=Hermetia illucens TaxID=343691 RepID=A0A7R8UZS0_HERIL|nr:uncharacterized protein LOC119657592 isoform X2 [Hermetia illucens]CAD7090027.1 unnamed protein product [Hermetia illucens]